MQILTCSVETIPCPLESQVWMQFDEAISPASLGITATEVAAVFGWGVGAMLLMWLLGYGAKLAIDVIRRV